MKKSEYYDIKAALNRVLSNICDNDDKMTMRERLAVGGTVMGFLMWFEEYYEKNKENKEEKQ